ncbi:MAG: DNA topoisomerase IV subunit A [Candidatus Sericytochromatia bacterium]|nr:MAG: DNA topoisomerase IV subunit A [Candidatus Sericytochromatia bacterium]
MNELKLKSLLDTNFIEYASYVIKERAIPNIDDGLKPVQRRILHTLFEIDDGKFHKVANIIGQTMKYHPHGDTSIEEALINMAQKDFLIDKQGNFGNIITGDPASAARYIEAKISNLAKETFYNPEITEYTESYDGRNIEPIYFPAKIPYLLMVGTEGIAVGLSTKILPHNFIELLDAQIKILKGRDFEIYPDFPQGGLIDVSNYEKGQGKIKVRAKIDIIDNKTLVIREIPFSTTTESLINSIEDAIEKGKLKITSINDFTTDKVEIELKVGHGANSNEILPRLYLYTDCELTLSSNIIVIKNNSPVEMNVNEILEYNTNKLISILEKELNNDINKLKIKLREKTLMKIFIENKIYSILENVDTQEELELLIENSFRPYLYEIRQINSDDIEKLISIPIKKISRFDLQKNIDEIKSIKLEIERKQEDISNITNYAIKYLKNLIEKYKNFFTRKTIITKFDEIDINKIAVNDIKVYYDSENKYIGTNVKSSEYTLLSSFDKLIMFFENGEYKVINIPDKIFIEEKIIFFSKQIDELVFSLVYFNKKEQSYYIKRFNINKFILDKVYRFMPEDCELVFFTSENNPTIEVNYTPTKRMKVTKEIINFEKILVKSVTSIGNKLSNKKIESIVLLKNTN